MDSTNRRRTTEPGRRARRARGSMRAIGPTGMKWELRVPLAKRADGRPSWLSRTFYGTEADAERALERLLADHAGKPRQELGRTFDAAFNDWLAAPSRKTSAMRSPSTVYREGRRYAVHVREALGDRPLTAITARELTSLYSSLIATGQSSTSVHRVHELIRAVLARECAEQRISGNVAILATCPKPRDPNPTAPYPEDVLGLMRLAHQDSASAYAIVRLAAVTGLRRSELGGLRRRHLRLSRALISIEEGQIAVPTASGSSRVTTRTKTGRGAELGLDDGTVAALDVLLAEQDATAAACGLSIGPDGFVFSADACCSRGLHPDAFSGLFDRLSAAMPQGVHIRLKDLRAFVATELEADGADVTTSQAVLRHASPSTTLRHYRAARERRVRMATRSLGDRLRLD